MFFKVVLEMFSAVSMMTTDDGGVEPYANTIFFYNRRGFFNELEMITKNTRISVDCIISDAK